MKAFIKEAARELGFSACGITTADPIDDLVCLEDAIASGRIASMRWLARDPKHRCDPASLLQGARTVICCALAYGDQGIEHALSDSRLMAHDSRLLKARFARGKDYHTVVRHLLESLWKRIADRSSEASAKLCVDTSPLLEKALAERAGLGWIGKHTLLINEKLGSFFVLGEIITDLEIEPDMPARDRCADCEACLAACPTRALGAPRKLDASRCIAYLTIEHRGELPEELASSIPKGAYGCDRCQEACPYHPASS